jgi:hypothetical protein
MWDPLSYVKSNPVYNRVNYDESNAINRITLSLALVEETATIFCKMVDAPGDFLLKILVSLSWFEVDK